MKQNIKKTTLALLFIMSLGFACAAASAVDSVEQKLQQLMKDSVVTISYDSGSLNLKDINSGKLYKYTEGPERSEGYAAIYYLFTSRPYLHIEAKGVTNSDFNDIFAGHASWFNLQTEGGATSTSFKMTDVAPFRCVKWEGEMAQVLIATNQRKEKTPKTILLVLRPDIEKPEFSYKVKHNDTTLTLGQFKAIKFDPKSEKPLAGYTLVIERTNSIVVDTITINNIKKAIKDTPLQEGKWELPLDNYQVKAKGKKIQAEIICRKFTDTGVIKSDKEKRDIDLSWEKQFNIYFIGGIALCVIFVAVLIILFIIIFRRIRKKSKPHTPKPSTNPLKTDGIKEIKGKDVKPQQIPNDIETGTNLGNSQDHPSDKELLADLTKANDEYSKKIKNLSKEIKDLQDEITTARQRRDDAIEKAKNAKNEAEEKAQKEIDRITKEAEARIKIAKQNEATATKRADEAEDEAKKKADKRIEEITRELNSKVEAANNRAAETEKRARQAIADAKATTTKERDEEWGKLVRLAKRLRELLETVPDDAFGSAGETLKAGITEYYNEIEKITALDNSIKDRLDKIRSFSLKLLQYPSGCWLHLLGRIYSYLSVETLRNQLDNDGLSLNTVDEAFRTLSAILAMQGIVVANCSPGYDSNRDPMTARLFQLDTQVDRITRWLGGRDRVQEEIPNHGGTIYDFGQLAYYTYEDTTIHQGSVIYYA